MNNLAKALKVSIIATALTGQYAIADTIFGIYAGAGSWQGEYSGEVGAPATTTTDLGMDDENNSFFYIAIEHPVPLLPNIKVQHNKIESNQTGTLGNDFSLDTARSLSLGGSGASTAKFPAGSSVTTDFDLSHTDATLYYEVLDNWLNLDLGVTLRKYSGYLEAKSALSSERIDLNLSTPLLYGKLQFDLPFTGFSAGVEGNYVAHLGLSDDSNLAEYTAKIGYQFDSALDLGIEAGYRSVTMDINDDVNTDIELKGPYIAATFHF